MIFEFLDLRLVLRFGVREVGGEFLNLRLVLLLGVCEMVFEFLDFTLVSRLSLREEVAIQTLDLRESVWNEGIEPTHRARK